jgi:hypothetical protein
LQELIQLCPDLYVSPQRRQLKREQAWISPSRVAGLVRDDAAAL